MNSSLLRSFVLFSLVTLFGFSTVASSNARAASLPLGPTTEFNIFTFGDNTLHNTDAEGRVAVGGNANFLTGGGSGYTIGSRASSSTYNLIVGGSLTNQYNNINGGVLVNGNVNWVGPSINGKLSVNGNASLGNSGGSITGAIDVVGTYSAPSYFPHNAAHPTVTPLPFSFNDVKSTVLNESNYLASLAATGTTTLYYQQVLLNATGPAGFYVFNVRGSDLSAAAGHGLSITAPAGSTVIVNVDGTSNAFQSMGVTLNGVDNQHVLYNFYQSTSLLVNAIAVEGTILAPNAAVNFVNGQLNGSLISQSVTGGGEAHLHLFTGVLPTQPVPEPASLVLAGGGLGMLGLARLMRRRRAHAAAAAIAST